MRVFALHGTNHMAWRNDLAAAIGFARQHALFAYYGRNDIFVPQTVLQRQHRGVRAYQGQGSGYRVLCLGRFNQHHHTVHHPRLLGYCYAICSCLRFYYAVYTVRTQYQTLLVDGFYVCPIVRDQPHGVARLG